jgi:hypothetical protein
MIPAGPPSKSPGMRLRRTLMVGIRLANQIAREGCSHYLLAIGVLAHGPTPTTACHQRPARSRF